MTISRFAFAIIFISAFGCQCFAAGGSDSPCLPGYKEGLDAYSSGDFAKAYEKFSAARECLLQEGGGEESSSSATVADDMGLASDALGDYPRALEHYSTALEIRQKLFGDDSEKTAESHDHVGVMLEATGDYSGALEHYLASLKIKESKIGRRSREAGMSHNGIGLAYEETGDYDKAMEHFNKALTILTATDGADAAVVGTVYNNIGMVHSARGENAEALDAYKKSGEIYLKALGENHPRVALNRNNIGMVYVNMGDYASALKEFQSALPVYIATSGEESADAATVYNNMGLAYKDMARLDESLEYYEKSLRIREKISGPDSPDTAASYNNIAGVHMDRGSYAKALELYTRALKIQKAAAGEAHPHTASAYNNVGMAYAALADYDKALENYQKALDIRLKTLGSDHTDTASSYTNIGMLYWRKGDYGLALDYARKALETDLHALGENHPDTATDYNNLGFMYGALGDHENELLNYQKASAIDLRLLGEKHPGTATDYNNIGGSYAATGDFDKALEYYGKALDIRREVLGEDNPDTGMSLNNIAWVYSELGDSEKAMQYYEKSLAIRLKTVGPLHPDVAACLNNMGMTLYNLKRYDEAVEKFTEALKAQCGGDAAARIEACRPDPVTVNAMWYLALARQLAGDTKGAVDMYEKAAEAVDTMRGAIQSEESKKFFGGNYYELYPQGVGAMAVLAQKTGDMSLLDRAYMHAEKGLGRVFLEMLGRGQAKIHGGLPDGVAARGAELEAAVNAARAAYDAEASKPKERQSQQARTAAYAKYEDAKKQLDEYGASLLRDYPKYAELMHPSPKPLAEIRKNVIGGDEAALEFLLGDGTSFLLMITKDGFRIVSLPDRKKIELEVKKYRALLMDETADAAKIQEAGGALFSLLLGKVAEDMKGFKSLLIVPTGDLYFLPFEALSADFGGGADYLIANFDIRYAPSLNVLDMTTRADAGQGGGKWLGFGDPLYQGECDPRVAERKLKGETAEMAAAYSRAMGDGGSGGGMWCRLPGTADEVESIAGLLKGDGATAVVELGENATEANFKKLAAGGARFIHVASHGTLGEGGARQPALVLSLEGNEGTGEDGFLTMTEVFDMKAPADMVVLSACKTGQGAMEKGEGVAGMGRAFLYAGARSLVVSLWSVADKETKELMTDFYKRMITGDSGRLEALSATRRDMAKRGMAPYFWAPFVYMGSRE